MRQGFRAFRLKGIRRQRRGDRVVCYHRATGIRLPDLREDHPDFIAAWARAEAGGEKPVRAKAGSLAALCETYLASPVFRAQSEGYRRILRREVDAIRRAYGTAPARELRARHVSADLARLEGSRPGTRLKAWRQLMAHGVRTGSLADDPSAGVKAGRRTAVVGHAPWSRDDVARFRTRWAIGTTPRACMELILWTGARASDAVAIGPQHVGGDGLLTYRQQKTKGLAHVPWTNPLPAWAAGWEAERALMLGAIRCLSGELTFLAVNGRPRSVKGVSNVVAQAARAAGLEGRSAHGLRKTRLTMIAEAGGSAHAIMAWGGHASLAEAQHYTRSADRRRLLIGAEQEPNGVSRAASDTLCR